MPGHQTEIGGAPQSAAPRKDVIRLAAGLVSMAVIVAALYYGQNIIIPIAVALLISFALNPVVTWMSRRGIPRAISTSIAIAAVLILVAGFGILLAAQVRSLALELPNYQSTILAKLTSLKDTINAPGIFDRAFETLERVQREVTTTDPAQLANGPQRVEVVPIPASPFEQALTWLGRSLEPLATLGIVFIFIFLTLLDRGDLRDRFLRLMGNDLHRSTDSMEEAGGRISKYLTMQLVVNVSYGIPMAIGLWLIGIPGALLWGTVAAVLRFIPYLGPMISAVFPLSLAFAVDDGWNMLIMVAALIVVLELVSNNVIEPLLYGTSTGLSTLSLIASAMFWTAIWGPIGLILSTPITVCLLVVGKNLPQLQFLDIILGSTPVLDPPMRLYQRLIANDPEEAVDLAKTEIARSSILEFYNDVVIDALNIASRDYLRNATSEHRLRLANGMDLLLDELREEYPTADGGSSAAPVICIGGKWHLDNISAEMMAHALNLEGVPATTRAISTINSRNIGELNLSGTETLCICYFSHDPAIPARHFARRLRLRWPGLKIVFALWNPPADLCDTRALERLSADAVVTSVNEAVLRIQHIIAPEQAKVARQAELPENEAQRVAAVEASGILEQSHREKLDAIARRAANVFDADFAVISTITSDMEYFVGQSGKIPGGIVDDSGRLLPMPRVEAICNYVIADDETLVIHDMHRDPRFSDNATIRQWGARFYAGAPIRGADGEVFGALCLLDSEPRELEEEEVELLEEMAKEVPAEMKEAD
nr:AI-2E family transporter [uncultured Roseococcus sp.]